MTTKIMIAEDNTSIISCYQDFLANDETFEIIGYALDGEKAIKMYAEKQPDLLLLDLNIPKKNGLDVIMELQKYEGAKAKCNIIVISGETKLINKLLHTRKVFMIHTKPVDYDRLYETIKEFQVSQEIDNFSKEKCETVMKRLNINPISRKGRILSQAVEMCYSNYSLLDNMELLYSVLGKINSCSPQRIKSNLRATADSVSINIDYTILTNIFTTEIIDQVKGITTKSLINGMVYTLK